MLNKSQKYENLIEKQQLITYKDSDCNAISKQSYHHHCHHQHFYFVRRQIDFVKASKEKEIILLRAKTMMSL
jgi:hypothetical protein